jgi:hypothetical protein
VGVTVGWTGGKVTVGKAEVGVDVGITGVGVTVENGRIDVGVIDWHPAMNIATINSASQYEKVELCI